MLEDSEREHIRLEESYRNEVRLSLKQPATNPLLGFLNSPFGLWLVSAVLVGGAGWLYTTWQTSAAQTRDRRNTIERLDLEIGYRFSQVQLQFYLASLPNRPPNERIALTRHGIDMLRQVPAGDYYALYPEYGRFGIPGIIAELRRHVDPAKQHEIDQLLAHLTGGPVLFEVRRVPIDDPTKVAGVVVSELVLKRWKDATHWYFLDGSKGEPFP